MSALTSPSPSDSTTCLRTVYAIQVVCTPASAASTSLSPNAWSLISRFRPSQAGSLTEGYQPVTYASS